MSCATTFIVGSDTGIRLLPGAHLINGRAVIVVVSGELTIMARRWEDLQRLVLALHDGIAKARQAEDNATQATFSNDAVGEAASMPVTGVASTQAASRRLEDGTGQEAVAQDLAAPCPDEVEAAEEDLLEAGGLRVPLQREAREQLRAEGVPLCRATVTLRARDLLHAYRDGDDRGGDDRGGDDRGGDDRGGERPEDAPHVAPTALTPVATTEPAALTEPTGASSPLRSEGVRVAARLRVDAAFRDLTVGWSES